MTESEGTETWPPVGMLPAHDDMLRIVETYLPDAARAAAGAPPQLVYYGGPILNAVEVFTVFWGSAWHSGPHAGLVGRLNEFFDSILSSALLDQLKEYSVPHYPIGHGKRSGTATLTSPHPGKTVTDRAIQHLLQQEITTNPAFPPAGRNTLYFLYLPSGVAVAQGGGRSCQAFCGYHNDIGGTIFYAVMPFPGCPSCLGRLSEFDALTSTTSHELCEAITDPIPGRGWYDHANGEIGDICAWQTKHIGQYRVQLEWSNQHNRCE